MPAGKIDVGLPSLSMIVGEGFGWRKATNGHLPASD
jgi:hypothetical protein